MFVGTFIDDPDDWAHVDQLRSMCAGLHAVPLQPARARVASLAGLAAGAALTLHYYRDAGLQRWVAQLLQRERIDATVVFSSSMAQYAQALPLPMLVDLVDVDSAKWTQYAGNHRWPMSWLYRREGQRLLAYERAVVLRSQCALFVTDKEADLFRALAPDCAARVDVMGNGVDTGYFAPDASRASPFDAGEMPLVFTGAMDYWPNIDAVTWFAQRMLPRLRQHWPALRFHIVGRNPSPGVRALAGASVSVSGTVPDVRPYLQHAAWWWPARLARGLQNKVLEAMAMGRPVVASNECAGAIDARPGKELLSAADDDAFVRGIDALLREPQRAAAIGQAGRQRVLQAYAWDAQLSAIDRHLDAVTGRVAEAAAA